MQINDFIRDGKGRTYRVGSLLGRGLFAKSYAIRSDDNQEWVLKIPLSPSDFPNGSEDLAKISRQILQEQWQLLSVNPHPNLLVPLEQFISDQGQYCLLYPPNDRNLTRVLQNSRSLQDLLRLVIQIASTLAQLPKIAFPHGNLHLNNIFQSGDGITFMDPLTPLLQKHFVELQTAWGRNSPFIPPEHRGSTLKKAQTYSDTYALSLILFFEIMGQDPKLELYKTGLNKILQNNLEMRLQSILQNNPTSNPNFRNQFITHALRFLGKALSVQSQPAQIYRFHVIGDFHQRLQDLVDLINPSIVQVSNILFKRPPGILAFESDENVEFSCTIKTTPPLQDFEDVICGTILLDAGRNNERITEYESSFDVSRQPSGRLRFAFSIEDLPPGDYNLRLGFLIKNSIGHPKHIDAQFQVVAALGYTPDSITVPPKNLSFPKKANPSAILYEISEEQSLSKEDDSNFPQPIPLFEAEFSSIAIDQNQPDESEEMVESKISLPQHPRPRIVHRTETQPSKPMVMPESSTFDFLESDIIDFPEQKLHTGPTLVVNNPKDLHTDLHQSGQEASLSHTTIDNDVVYTPAVKPEVPNPLERSILESPFAVQIHPIQAKQTPQSQQVIEQIPDMEESEEISPFLAQRDDTEYTEYTEHTEHTDYTEDLSQNYKLTKNNDDFEEESEHHDVVGSFFRKIVTTLKEDQFVFMLVAMGGIIVILGLLFSFLPL